MSSGLASPLLVSVLVHLLGLTTLSVMGSALGGQASPPDFIPAELVLIPPAPVAVPSVPQPDLAPILPPALKAMPTPVSVAPMQATQLPPAPPPVREQNTPPKPVKQTPTHLVKADP